MTNTNQQQAPIPLKGSTVWNEVQVYIKALFEALPKKKREIYRVTATKFISDLDKYFKGKYSAQEVARLLKNGFEVEPGIYQFSYKDFKEVNTP
ncbi:MAG: hypothetical protein V4456_11580 [Bacteroidota bacterium]